MRMCERECVMRNKRRGFSVYMLCEKEAKADCVVGAVLVRECVIKGVCDVCICGVRAYERSG